MEASEQPLFKARGTSAVYRGYFLAGLLSSHGVLIFHSRKALHAGSWNRWTHGKPYEHITPTYVFPIPRRIHLSLYREGCYFGGVRIPDA